MALWARCTSRSGITPQHKGCTQVSCHAGATGKAENVDQQMELPDERKLESTLGGLHALIRQRTAAMGLRASVSSSSATSWGD